MKKIIQIVLKILIIIFWCSSQELSNCKSFNTELKDSLKCEDPEKPVENFWSSEASKDKAYVMAANVKNMEASKFIIRAKHFQNGSPKTMPKDLSEKMKSKYIIKAIKELVIDKNLFIFYDSFLENFKFYDHIIHGKKLEENKELDEFIFKLASAIFSLHACDYVHANLNFGNIIMIDNSPMITNFDDPVSESDEYDFKGSLAYASPEFIRSCLPDLPVEDRKKWLNDQIENNPDYIQDQIKTTKTKGKKNDMYALGVMIYNITQNKLPYDEIDYVETVLQKLEGKLTFEKPIHLRIKDMIHTLMTENDLDRISSINFVNLYYPEKNSLLIDNDKNFTEEIDLKKKNPIDDLGNNDNFNYGEYTETKEGLEELNFPIAIEYENEPLGGYGNYGSILAEIDKKCSEIKTSKKNEI